MKEKEKKTRTYRDAGVDIEGGENFVEIIKSIKSKAIDSGIGAFSSAIEIDTQKYKNPIILSSTDGVGTKILVAKELKIFNTIGIDLVAMCVNDILASGATPISFLDYIACGKLNTGILKEVIKGIVSGCEIASCKLSGGETAEMPDMYDKDDFDLAGFAIGIAERDAILPKTNEMRERDILLGIPSTGIHSNGLSLARKVIPPNKEQLRRELLKPTKIYTKEIGALLKTKKILGIAHITGGGLYTNIERILPKGFFPVINRNWKIPEIFRAIQDYGDIETEEMYRVFNMGIGMVIVIHDEDRKLITETSIKEGITLIDVGYIKNG